MIIMPGSQRQGRGLTRGAGESVGRPLRPLRTAPLFRHSGPQSGAFSVVSSSSELTISGRRTNGPVDLHDDQMCSSAACSSPHSALPDILRRNFMEETWNFRGKFVGMVEDELSAVLQRIGELGGKIQHALAAGDVEQAAGLHAELRRQEERRDQLFDSLASGSLVGRPRHRTVSPREELPPVTVEQPLREIVLEALTYLGRSASTALITDVVRAREGFVIPAGRLASLRRDEERSFSSTSTRTAYVVPGLTHDRFAPARGILTSSAFPLSHRIVAPASGRVDLLNAVITLAEDAATRAADEPQRIALLRLLWKLGRSIPDALGSDIDPLQVAQAARTELAVHDAADRAEREAAAERARHQLDSHQQLFGHRTAVVRNRRTKEA
ncbi:hypothetical protein ACL02T_09645 [Pseudonocardia sp. RS010]|uniref:hypothetical protein n=1 Tax=Pseudonocardia sp. RS010 TaxID=3385979 RepID=UPI00399FC9B7